MRKDKIQLVGTVEARLYGPDGRLKKYYKPTHNLVVDAGFNNIIELLSTATAKNASGGGYNLDYMGVGWAEPDAEPPAPDAGDRNLPMPGAIPPILADAMQKRYTSPDVVVTQIDDTSFKLVLTVGSGEPDTTATWPKAIRSFGVFWDGGTEDDELFSWIRRAPISKADADTLEVTYTFSFS